MYYNTKLNLTYNYKIKNYSNNAPIVVKKNKISNIKHLFKKHNFKSKAIKNVHNIANLYSKKIKSKYSNITCKKNKFKSSSFKNGITNASLKTNNNAHINITNISEYKLNHNIYLNIHFFYQDLIINKFVNTIIIKDGKKYKAFNIFMKMLWKLKFITAISPIRILKSLFKFERLVMLEIRKTFKKKRPLSTPKMYYNKYKYNKYLFFLKNKLKNLDIEKKFLLSDKLTYLVIDEILFFSSDWHSFLQKNIETVYTLKNMLLHKKY